MTEEIGKVTHYYDKVGVAVVELSAPLTSGETITLTRGDTHFSQQASSMQIDHENVEQAKAGTVIGLKSEQRVRPGTVVLRGEVPAEEVAGAAA
jgi:peptide subunit release factor RF-3